ncbi:DUF3846 domain-containing protein [Pectinatus haikarae]|uniref:Uncharacterized protein n=1 Tax=Pectinatus haikarae TaxID=349096 RepID=A0ABT9Y6G2_9FIRM|nr:hypothetical protein [Pectinatus haikarae]MDQ0202739.1 hypothetical protein [Pectinatus haikarae]
MEENRMHAILIEPEKEPEILLLPTEGLKHEEAIRDVLEGNYGAVEFFKIQEGISLFILINDLSIVLGMKPNRRFPSPDEKHIIFGKAIFIAAYNGESADTEGTLDMPEKMCRIFIEQIKQNFSACDGSEKPDDEDKIYYDNKGQENERAFYWQEIKKPVHPGRSIAAGRVNFYGQEDHEIMEINGRFFKKVTAGVKAKKN